MRFEGVSKAFPGVLALDNVTFGIKEGSVHIVMGENGAGKSTLMKIINGSYEATEGKIYLNEKPVSFRNIHEAEAHGVGMIYQELQYIPDFTIEKNLLLCREPMRPKGFIDYRQLNRSAVKILETENLDYNPKTLMRNLSVSDIQLLEITRTLTAADIDVIIMDEPTSALSNAEVTRLFDNIRRLKERGITIIYISHKMDEIFQIADDITVLRDGKHIHTGPADTFTPDGLIKMMVGRELSDIYPKENIAPGDTVLQVEGLTSSYTHLKDINLYVRSGEIVGLAGLMGAGRTEVARAIFGLDPYDSGKIFVQGKKVKIRNVPDAVRQRIAMATEDRRRYGLISQRSIRENIALPNLRHLRHGPFLDNKREKSAVIEMFDRLRIKAPNMNVETKTLSGGNQQKVVLAKWLLANPLVLILDEPTRGIDVGAKHEIYKLMNEMAKAGIGIIMISSELPEFIGMCDRAYTMRDGAITGELQKAELTQENIMAFSTGGNI